MKEIMPMASESMHIPKIKIFVTSFLRYHKDLANVSWYFWRAWSNSSKKVVSTAIFLNIQKINFIAGFFLEILLTYFEYFRDASSHPSSIGWPFLKVLMFVCSNNQVQPSLLSWDVKILQTCFFGLIWHEWVCSSMPMDSIKLRKLWYVCVCMQKIFFPHFFLEILQRFQKTFGMVWPLETISACRKQQFVFMQKMKFIGK